MNAGINRSRVDTYISPQAAVIVKPIENLSIYSTYSVSYLPASGDQFSALNNGTVILAPQKFENKEVGVKWNILPRLLYTAAVYDLDRTNVPLADPNNPGFFILSGTNRIRGFETDLNGYVTDDWQSKFGYAYTDARVTSDTSATIVAGNRIQLVPFHQFSWWNKYQITPMWAASVGVDILLRLVRVVRRHCADCQATSASTPQYSRRSMRPGRRRSISRTSSTGATGHRRTATTTSHQASRGQFV